MDQVKVLDVCSLVLACDSVLEGGDVRFRIVQVPQELSLVQSSACLRGAHHWSWSGCRTWWQCQLCFRSRLDLVLHCCCRCGQRWRRRSRCWCSWCWCCWRWCRGGWRWCGRRGRWNAWCRCRCAWSRGARCWRGSSRCWCGSSWCWRWCFDRWSRGGWSRGSWRWCRGSWRLRGKCNVEWASSAGFRTCVTMQQRCRKTPALLDLERALVAVRLHFLKLLMWKPCVGVMKVHELIRAWQWLLHINTVIRRWARPGVWDLVNNQCHVRGVDRDLFALINHGHVGFTWVRAQVPDVPQAIQLIHSLHLSFPIFLQVHKGANVIIVSLDGIIPAGHECGARLHQLSLPTTDFLLILMLPLRADLDQLCFVFPNSLALLPLVGDGLCDLAESVAHLFQPLESLGIVIRVQASRKLGRTDGLPGLCILLTHFLLLYNDNDLFLNTFLDDLLLSLRRKPHLSVHL
mmetsp:Transcript_39459/g.91089  ORF Transcript_39459/g.91089 Transcript_39459/m.91089 type:complete len:460 (-) Transcript_39459:435-1814(-)